MDILSRNGWVLVRHTAGEIIVSHKDGSGCLIREGAVDNDISINESLFFRMMNDFLLDNELTIETLGIKK